MISQTIKVALLFLLTSGLCLAEQSTSHGATKSFYDWYLASGNDYRAKFSEAKPYFTKELYGLLSTGFSQSPENDFWVDFDPFVNAQTDAGKIDVGRGQSLGGALEVVVVSPYYNFGGGEALTPGPEIKVYCLKENGQWKIANMAYTGDYPFELKTYLKQGLGI